MIDSRYKHIDKILAAFNFSTLQSFKTLIFLMDRENISMDEFSEFIKLKSSAMASDRPKGTICPECTAPMALEYVNVNSRTQTGDDSKIVYTCIKCLHQIFE